MTDILNKTLTLASAVCLFAVAPSVADTDDAHLGWKDGLSQTTIFSIVQDSSGLVWCATEDGLNRWNGDEFEVFRNDSRDPASLPNNVVRGLHLDSAGDVWVATEGGGIGRWDESIRGFERFAHDPFGVNDSLSNNYARAILRTTDGHVWTALRNAGLDRLDPATGEIKHFGTAFDTLNVFALVEATDGTLYAGADDGLYVYDADLETFDYIQVRNGNKAIRVRTMAEDRRGKLWLGSKDAGLFRWDPRTGGNNRYTHDSKDRDTISDNTVQRIFEDSLGNLWVGTAAGLDRFHRRSQTFEHFVPEDSAMAGSGAITSIFEDQIGLLWVGTELGGVSLWKLDDEDPETDDFEKFQTDVVTAFAEGSDGHLFVGTVGGGLLSLDRASGDEQRYTHDPHDPKSLSDDRVMTLLKDSKGNVWIGTQRGGLNKLNLRKQRFKSYTHNPSNRNSLSANGVMSLLEDSAGTLWIGTFGGGLNAYSGRGKRFTSFRHDPEDSESLSSDRITAMLENGDGRLWLGTDGGGLNLFDPTTGKSQSFLNDPRDEKSLPADTVCALFRDAAGTLWVGTRGGGLARMDVEPAGGQPPLFTSFNESHGLPNSVVYAIQPDSTGNLWVSTNQGLSRVDTQLMTFMNFDAEDGLQANEFNLGASYRSTSGELFFGGINGFNAFDPDPPAQGAGQGSPPLVLAGL